MSGINPEDVILLKNSVEKSQCMFIFKKVYVEVSHDKVYFAYLLS